MTEGHPKRSKDIVILSQWFSSAESSLPNLDLYFNVNS